MNDKSLFSCCCWSCWSSYFKVKLTKRKKNKGRFDLKYLTTTRDFGTHLNLKLCFTLQKVVFPGIPNQFLNVDTL